MHLNKYLMLFFLVIESTFGFSQRKSGPEKSLDRYCQSLGLIDIQQADSSIRVDLMYARKDNFTGKILYRSLTRAYLHPDAAGILLKAQKLLEERRPGYHLVVYDAARPMSVQQQMWNVVKGTEMNRYVANPAKGGGLHNYGLAVDISIAGPDGKPLPMGTQVDHLGKEAHITEEPELVRTGKITEAERRNRLLLRSVMKRAGFRALPTEWWHFNYCSRETARKNYKIIR